MMNRPRVPSRAPHLPAGAGSAFPRIGPHLLGALLVLALACLLYWAVLLDSQRKQLAHTEEQIRLRATQISAALSMQVETLITGLERLAHNLATDYFSMPGPYFMRSAESAFEVALPGSITQIAVADEYGEVVYSSLASRHDQPAVRIADRDHFRVHAERDTAGLYISRPVSGRISGVQTIQFSYPIQTPEGSFAGVVVLSVPPDYISTHFRQVVTGNDVAMLLHADGSYMASSAAHNTILDKQVPAERELLLNPQVHSGEYRVLSPIDEVERYYAWRRIQNYPLVVATGLDRESALAATTASIKGRLHQNLLSTVAVLGAALWITLLFARLDRDRKLLAESKERYKLALEGGNLGSWDWEAGNGHMVFDQRWCAMLGYAPGELVPTIDIIQGLVHPGDRDRLQADFDAHVRGLTEVFQAEHRILHRDGHWIWISARGRATRRAGDGSALRITGTCADISQRVAGTLLRHALLNNTGAAIFLVTPERNIRFSNQRAVDIFSADGRPLDGQSMRVIHCNDSTYEIFHAHYAALRSGKDRGDGTRVEYHLHTGHGEPRWFNIHGTLLDPDQPDGDVIWTMIDVTERRRAEEALSAARERLAQVIEHFPGGVLVEDEQGRVMMANQALCDLLAFLPIPAGILTGQDHASLRHFFPREVLDVVLANESGRPHETMLADGRSIRATRIPIRHGAEGADRLWIVYDVTEQRRHEQALEHMASTDALTGLANRRTFMIRLKAELAHIARGGHGGMVIMIDLDHFKQINDHYGHAAGDAVLAHLSRILTHVLRREDMAARLGGEEFGILLPDTDPVGAAALSERLRAALEQSSIATPQGNIRVTASLGLAPLTGDIKTLLARADAALYQAKHNGRNRVVTAADEDAPG